PQARTGSAGRRTPRIVPLPSRCCAPLGSWRAILVASPRVALRRAIGGLWGRRSEVGEDRQNAAVVIVGGGKIELSEDIGHVLLDGAEADHKLARDGGVGPALSNERERLALARGELGERVLAAAGLCPHQ